MLMRDVIRFLIDGVFNKKIKILVNSNSNYRTELINIILDNWL